MLQYWIWEKSKSELAEEQELEKLMMEKKNGLAMHIENCRKTEKKQLQIEQSIQAEEQAQENWVIYQIQNQDHQLRV